MLKVTLVGERLEDELDFLERPSVKREIKKKVRKGKKKGRIDWVSVGVAMDWEFSPANS